MIEILELHNFHNVRIDIIFKKYFKKLYNILIEHNDNQLID